MNNIKTIALVIADIDEYVHIESMFGDAFEELSITGCLKSHKIKLQTDSKQTIDLITVCSGIGKVNAAMATAAVAPYADMIINAGLSGGFGNSKKYDLVVGDKYFEHDFDLTAIGYKLAQKPDGEQPLLADVSMVDDIVNKFPFVKKGTFVTGDGFICHAEKHKMLSDTFYPIACDMESAAVGAVAKRFQKPFVSLRMVSDGADNDSADTYTDTLKGDRANGWLNLTLSWIKSL